MAFMQPQYTNEDFYEVTTTEGEGWLVPAEGFGDDPDPSDFADYIEFGEPEEIEKVSGWFARLSAPGYMDATEWGGPFKTKKEAKKYIEDTWEVDPETGDAFEENPRKLNASRRDVINAWQQGKRKTTASLRTDGDNLYSYDLLIGERVGGKLVVYDYTGDNRISKTTTTQVNAAKGVADEVREPPAGTGRWSNPMGPVGRTALGAGLGSLGGAVVGGVVLGGPGALVGSVGGGAAGGHYAAPGDRKKRGATGGAIGGVFGPVGAAIGGAVAGDKADKKKKNPGLRKLKSKLLR